MLCFDMAYDKKQNRLYSQNKQTNHTVKEQNDWCKMGVKK